MDALEDESLKASLNQLIEKEILTEDEIKLRILTCVKSLSTNESLHIIDSFLASNISELRSKEQFLYELFIDHIKIHKNDDEAIIKLAENILDISDRNKILDLLRITKYTLTLSTGQRRYGGPPPMWDGPEPGSNDPAHCCQVHIGKLGKTIFEDVLVPAIESCGRIYQLRIMVEPSTGYNKGYAFADYFTRSEAELFIQKYNNKSLIPSEPPIKAKLSIPNCRLFLAGIPTYKNKEEVELEIKRVVEQAKNVFAFPSNGNPKRNRGFAFIDFNTHNEANQARKRFQQGKILIFNSINREIEWAETSEFKEQSQFKLKTLHVRFYPLEVEPEKLTSFFEEFPGLKKVDKLKEFAFVEFDNEESAKSALEARNNSTIDGIRLTVSYAKSEKKNLDRKSRHRVGKSERGGRERSGERRGDRNNSRRREHISQNRSNYDDPYYDSWNRGPRYPPPMYPPPSPYDMGYSRPYYDMYPSQDPRYPRPYPSQVDRPPYPQSSGNIRSVNWSHSNAVTPDTFFGANPYTSGAYAPPIPQINPVVAPTPSQIDSSQTKLPSQVPPSYPGQPPPNAFWQ